jgi:hypothetical protein
MRNAFLVIAVLGTLPLHAGEYDELNRLPPIDQEIEQASAAAAVPNAAEPGAAEPQYYTFNELKGEMKKFTWTMGDFKITPFGYIACSGVYETEKSVTGEYTLYVISPDVQGEDGFYVDAKASRFGLDLAGPSVPWLADAKLGGRLEFDFEGPFINSNQGTILFRQGYIEAKNEDYRILVGQAWEVMSPLYPMMLLYVPGSGGGNLGYRKAQVRGERYYHLSDELLLTCQGALTGNVVWDFTGDPYIEGQHTGWPILEGRVATTVGERQGPGARPVTIGFSGHIGQQEFDFHPPLDPVDDLVRQTWSANIDFCWPITSRLNFQLEAFTGSNLGAYMGGVLQGIDRETHRAIRSRGGWFDFGYRWTDQWHTHAGYSIDDPINGDLTSGRTYNHFIFGNVMYDVTKNFLLGLELSSWKTLWVDQRPGNSLRCEFMVKYGF